MLAYPDGWRAKRLKLSHMSRHLWGAGPPACGLGACSTGHVRVSVRAVAMASAVAMAMASAAWAPAARGTCRGRGRGVAPG